MIFKIKKYLSLSAVTLLVIMLAAVFFRFYNTPNRYGFDYDPTRDALIVDYAIKTFQLPLIGPPSGIGSFNFGPWYYYQLILFKIIFPVAYAPWIYIGILSTITVFIMYKIGELLKGKTLGLLLGVLTALSPAETGQIRALSNPTLVPFYSVLTIWMFIKFIKKTPSLWMIFLWGIVLGIGINNHYQLLGFLLLPIILFIYRKENRLINIISFTIGIFITFLPLLLFNYIHGWATVKGLYLYITQEAGSKYIPNRWLYYVRDFWPAFLSYVLGLPSLLGLPVGLSIGFSVLYLLIKRQLSNVYIFLIITFLISFFALRFFPGQREYYYLLYLHPFIFIFLSLVLFKLFSFKLGRFIGFLFLSVILIGMTLQSVERLASAGDQKQFKTEAKEIASNFPDKKFILYECSSSQKNRTRGVVFFLNTFKKISEAGIKIVYPNEKCPLPAINNLPLKYLRDINAVDVSYASEKLLLEYGWKPVTSKTVFTQLSQGLR